MIIAHRQVTAGAAGDACCAGDILKEGFTHYIAKGRAISALPFCLKFPIIYGRFLL